MADIKINGKNVHYLTSPGFQEGRRNGHSVLLVHGATDTHKAWSSQFRFLEKEHSPVAIDLPGRGGSEGPALDNSRDQREFIKAFVDALGLRPFVYVGHSMGGSMALDYGIHYPDDVNGIIMVGSSPSWIISDDDLKLWKDDPDVARERDLASIFSKQTPRHIVDKALKDSKETPNEACYRDLKACQTFDPEPDFSKVRVPVLVVCGDEDEMSIPGSREVAEKVSDATLEMLSPCGHPIMLEQPERLNQLMEEFLRRL